MSDGVELKVVLVGDDPDQQDAFANPRTDSQPSTPAPTQPPSNADLVSPPATPKPDSETDQDQSPLLESLAEVAESNRDLARTRDSQATKPADVAPPIKAELVSPPPSEAIGADNRDPNERLIDSLKALTQSIDKLAQDQAKKAAKTAEPPKLPTDPTKPSDDAPTGKLDALIKKLTGGLESLVDRVGLSGTRVGQLVTNAARNAGAMASRGGRLATVARSTAGGAGSAATTGGATAAAGGAGGAAATGGVGLAVAGGAAGVALAGIAVQAAVATMSIRKLMSSIDSLAVEFGDLSIQVASGRAQFAANAELMRLDRARKIGPEVAQLDAARMRINESMYEVQTKIYELLLKASPPLELLLDMVNVGVRQVDVVVASVNRVISLMTVWNPNDDQPAKDELVRAMDEARDAIRELANLNGAATARDPLLEELLGGGVPNPAQPPPHGGLGGDL